MKINQILIIGISVIIGIGLLAVVGATSQSALSGETEIVDIETAILYDEFPIQINAGDSFVYTLPEFREGIAYTIYAQHGTSTVSRWGFSHTGNAQSVHYNNTMFTFAAGTWDTPVLSAPYSDAWITWSVDGSVGTLTFLQDFPVVIDTIITSTSTLRNNWGIITTFDTTDVLSTSVEVPVYTTTDRLVQLVPFIGVLVLVGSVIVYIRIKH